MTGESTPGVGRRMSPMDAASARRLFNGWIAGLARAHTTGLVALARAEGLPAEDALDEVQDAFHRFLMRPDAATLAASPEEARALLATLVRNGARNRRRRHSLVRPHEPIDETLAEDAPSLEEILTLAERHAQLLDCLDELDDARRRVVTLRMLEELGGAEVARTLGLTPGHVAVLLYRAKRDLLRCMTR